MKISYGNIHYYPYLYGWGDGETTFVLPNYRGRVIQGGDTLKILSSGLPNITGSYTNDYNYYAVNVAGTSGAISATTKNVLYFRGDGGSAGNVGLHDLIIDASKSNSIYGSSQTVQSPAIQSIPQIKY